MAKTYAFVLLLLSGIGWSQRNSTPPSLTIYNQNFAVVRQTVPLQLKTGPNQLSFDEITSYVEPSSVMLRDPAEQVHLSILEQNYRSDAISQYTLLRSFEGKEVDFLVRNGDLQQTQHGRVIRAGTLCIPGTTDANGSYCYADNSVHYATEPIIELDGKLRFGLPGVPMFPSLGDAALLKPALDWTLQSDKTAQFNAELSYVTGGFTWEAIYNVVTPNQGDLLDLVGWVTLQNRSGRSFEDARLQLMAGDVNKFVMPGRAMDRLGRGGGVGGGAYAMAGAVPAPQVTESTLDEYHLYSLQRPSTLLNGETKQVEFLRAANIPSKRIYVYEGYALDLTRYPGGNWAQYKVLQDYLMRYIAREAGRLHMPVHFHTGGGCGGYFDLQGSNPVLLESLFNDPSLRKTNFVMVHAGAGNYDTLVPYLLMKPNVYADFSEQTWIIAPHHMSQAIRYMLESYPEKVLFGTDLFPGSPQIDWEEIGYQTVEGGRSALALALTGMLRDGEITRAQATSIARMVLSDNASKLYGW